MLSVYVVELHKSPTANLTGWIDLSKISERFNSALRRALHNFGVRAVTDLIFKILTLTTMLTLAATAGIGMAFVYFID